MSLAAYVSGLTYVILSRGGPSMYVYFVVCFCMKTASYVRGVVVSLHTVHTLDDDLECPFDYELSLLPNLL